MYAYINKTVDTFEEQILGASDREEGCNDTLFDSVDMSQVEQWFLSYRFQNRCI